MYKLMLICLVLLPTFVFSQKGNNDSIFDQNKISSMYLSGGINSIHYSNYSGIYDSVQYFIDNSKPCLNFGIGYLNSLYFDNREMKNKFLFAFGGEITTRQYRINYLGETVKINELFFMPIIGFGGRTDIKHNLWLINSYKAIEIKINLGVPILLTQIAIINHSKIKSTNSVFLKFHFGLDVKFSSLKSCGRGHQLGGELFLENSSEVTPNTIPFKTPYYLGCRVYYCILNKAK